MNLYNVFYRQYYLDSGFGYQDKVIVNSNGQTHISNKNSALLGATLTPTIQDKQRNDAADATHGFQLEVAYPGLITGIGINHNIKGIESEFKLGMHFDYTTGMPVIYGSTVKGVLKSYIKHYDIADNSGLEIDNLDLEKEIFEGLKRIDNGGSNIPVKDRIYEPMSIYDRDIFFDAVIVEGVGRGKFLASDTICPHTDGPLKNPKPVNFLKIAPGVTIEFRFKLHNGIIDTIQKKALFEEILRDWGIGAKTNVGYGQFM